MSRVPDTRDCKAYVSLKCTRDGNLQALMRMAFQGLLTSVPIRIITTIKEQLYRLVQH